MTAASATDIEQSHSIVDLQEGLWICRRACGSVGGLVDLQEGSNAHLPGACLGGSSSSRSLEHTAREGELAAIGGDGLAIGGDGQVS